jgi:hypothetical protein
MCTYEPAGAVYSLDNGVPVSKRLAADLVNPQRQQGDLFLRPNEDGLFPGFYPDVACGRMTRALTSTTTTLTDFGTSLEPFRHTPTSSQRARWKIMW